MTKRLTIVKPLSDKIGSVTPSITGDTATIIYDDGLYEDNLPEDIPSELVLRLEKYNNNYVDAIAHRNTEEAIQIFNDNKDVDTVIFEAPFVGSGRVKTNIVREHVSHNPKTGEEITNPNIKTEVTRPAEAGSKSFHKFLKTELKERIK